MLSKEQLETIRPTLFAGQYNLLLGAGTSMDSSGSDRKQLKGAGDLAADLCKLKGASPGTPLARVSVLLTPDEVEKYLTLPYSNTKPGETVKRVTSFVWRSVYTFNIDDTLEAAYETSPRRKQRSESLNYDSIYRGASNLGKVQIVHLHGFVREPDKGYVFSVSEYARVTRGQNAWMHVLSELLASEPFIIAGTTLNESDLEYYLAGRTEQSGRKNRGPSLLIEPYPDVFTDALCKRHDLILVKGTFAEFLHWLGQELGAAPTVGSLTVPSVEGLFARTYGPDAQVELFSSFELVKPVGPNPAGQVSPFFYGRAATWSDLESGLDLPTEDERKLGAKIRNYLAAKPMRAKIFSLIAEAGTGKTTALRRTAYALAKEGSVVLNLSGKLALDTENTRNALLALTRPAVLVIDNLADHASAVRAILEGLAVTQPITIMGADRDYRQDHIDRVLAGTEIEYLPITQWKVGGYQDLIEKYRKAGLVGMQEALRTPFRYAQLLVGEPISIAGCRILKDFKPLDEIVHSLWTDSNPGDQARFAMAALSEYCYSGGIFYPIIERAVPSEGLGEQLSEIVPLPLAYSEDGDYVLPLHPAIGDRIIVKLNRENRPLLLDIFKRLAEALAPYVNKKTSLARTPEARLAGRLFNSDKVVKFLLREHGKDFYVATQDAWQWNARYWEQRALFSQSQDVETAIQYARHAVAIDEGPFPRTTLATILSKKMDRASPPLDALFDEIYDQLFAALKAQSQRIWTPTPHPYSVLFHTAIVYLDAKGKMPLPKAEWIERQVEYSRRHFPKDMALQSNANRLEKLLSRGKS